MKKLLISLVLTLTSVLTAAESENPTVTMVTNHGDVTIELLEKSAPETVKNFIGLAEGTKEFTDASGNKVTKPFYDGLIFHRVIENFMIQGGCPLGTGSGKPGYTFKDEINADSLDLQKIKAFDKETEGVHSSLRVYSPQEIQKTIVKPILDKLGATNKEQFQEKQKEFEAEFKKVTKAMTIKNFYEALGYQYDDKLTSFPMKKGFLAMANSGPNSNGSQFYINLKDNRYLDGKHTVFGKVTAGMDIVEKISLVKKDAKNKPEEPVKIISIRLNK